MSGRLPHLLASAWAKAKIPFILCRRARDGLTRLLLRLLRHLADGVDQWFERRRRGYLKIIFVIMLGFFLFADEMVIVVPSGHAAVLWHRFGGGTVEEAGSGEGTMLIWPWDRAILYDIRSQVGTSDLHVLSRDGLDVAVQIVYRYIPNPAALGSLHKLVGPDYARILLEPEVSSATHGVTAGYSSEVLYSSKRDELREEILQRVMKRMEVDVHGRSTSLVVFQEFLLNRIQLPERVNDAIEAKEQQRQKAEEYTFRLLREQKESERRVIEAQGIRDFIRQVMPGITDSYLRYQGLNVTRDLVHSPNTKIFMIGSGGRGAPVIVDTGEGRRMVCRAEEGDGAASAPPAADAASGGEAPPAQGGMLRTIGDKVSDAVGKLRK